MNEAEALAYLTSDSGAVPCSRWGRNSDDCAPVAYEVARIHVTEGESEMTTETLDLAMGLVVNDDDSVGSFLWEHASEAFREEYAEDLADYRPRDMVSSGHFSHDQQVGDALSCLQHTYPNAYAKVRQQFPESIIWDDQSAWIDTEAMGVDVEWSSWLTDAIESTGVVFWDEGEPYTYLDAEDVAPSYRVDWFGSNVEIPAVVDSDSSTVLVMGTYLGPDIAVLGADSWESAWEIGLEWLAEHGRLSEPDEEPSEDDTEGVDFVDGHGWRVTVDIIQIGTPVGFRD